MTEYEKAVKHKLIDIDKSPSWLVEQIKQREGCYIDSGYLSKILSGKRNAPKIKTAINEILNIDIQGG